MTNNNQLSFMDELDNTVAMELSEAINQYAEEIFNANRAKGFWDMCFIDIATGHGNVESIFEPNNRNFGEVISLIVEELDEAVNANRKDLKDDHLPQYEGKWTELADAVIRIFDVCGAHGVPIGTIIKDKLEYNKKRPYKHGKKY